MYLTKRRNRILSTQNSVTVDIPDRPKILSKWSNQQLDHQIATLKKQQSELIKKTAENTRLLTQFRAARRSRP